MADVTTYDGIIKLISDGYYKVEPFYKEFQAATTLAGDSGFTSRRIDFPTRPALPGSVTKYRFLNATGVVSTVALGTFLIGIGTNLGSLDISGASGTFTDGSAMPSITSLGASAKQTGIVFAEVTTVLNSAPGTYSFTYKNQAGTGSRTSATITPSNSAAVGSAGFVSLQTGDWGVQDITAASRSSGTTPSGVIKFWGVQTIAMFANTPATTALTTNLQTSGFNFPSLAASDQILIIHLNTNQNAMAYSGSIMTVAEH